MMVPINWHDLGYLTPELVVVLGAFVVLALDLVVPKGSKRVLGWAGIVTLLLAMGAVYSQWSQTGAPQPIFGTLVRDLYSLFFDVVFLLSGLLGILVSLRYVENAGVSRGGYYSLILFAVLGMMLMAASTELLTLFISYEILSLSVYVLSGIARARAEAAEASMKYFLLGAFSSGFLIYGIALVYGATGNTGLEAIRGYVAQHGLTGNALLLIGLALITIGFAFKVAVVPFHVWVPDVYQGAPLPVTAFMSAGVKAAAFAVLARVLFTGFPGLVGTWQPVLWVLAVLTMILGNTSAIPQENIKRMLAYSSIAHAGYMLVALSAFSAGEVALGSLLYYGLVYTVMNIGAFAVVLLVGRAGEENQRLVDYHGLSVRSPWLAGAMAFAILFGFGSGLTSIVGGTLPLELFGQAGYGSRSGWINSVRLVSSAIAPFIFSLLQESLGVHAAIWIIAGFGCLGIAAFVAMAAMAGAGRTAPA